MAQRGRKLRNAKTGQAIEFVRTAADTNGEVLEMISTYEKGSKEPVAHYHPYQVEDFTVLEGSLHVRMADGLRTLQAGDRLHIPVNAVHGMWNAGDQRTVVNWQVRPALNTEEFFETAYGLAEDGKVNDAGMPSFLQSVKLANKYHRVFRLARPPFAVQRVVFALLSPIASLLGYKPTYAKYLSH